jgi:MFS family permease
MTTRTKTPRTETPPHFWWNFVVLQVDVSTFVLGLAFLDAATVLPLLLTRLGATSTTIGAVQGVQTLALMLPPLFAAHWIHGQRRHLRFLVTVCGIGRAGLLTLLVALLLWGRTQPGLVLGWFFVVYALFWATDGACQVSWLDIIAKTIPARARGRLFGTMQVLGGVLAAGAGLVVQAVLRPGRFTFPMEFALLLTLWCAGAAVSQVALVLLREPEGAAAAEKPALWAHLAQAPGFLRTHRRVAQIIGIRFLLSGAALSVPFYMLFARQHLGVSEAAAGFYLTAQKVGEIATGALWGYLSDRFGPAIGLRAVAAGVVCAPVLALLAAYSQAWLFPLVFVALGGAGVGVWVLANSALLEAVADHERPFAVGVASLCQTPTALYAVAGGALLHAGLPYPALFALTLMLTACGLLASMRLPAKTSVPHQASTQALAGR